MRTAIRCLCWRGTGTSLDNVVDLYSRYDQTNQLMPLVRQLLPVLSNPDIAILLHLPAREGAKLIPAQMH